MAISFFETIWSGNVWKDEEHLHNLKTKFLENLDSKYKSSQDIIDLIAKTGSDNERIQLFKPCFEWTTVDDKIAQTFKKCSILSTKFRETGNQEYKNGSTTKALRAYNLAIVFAPPGSDELGTAYGNRSAVFLFLNEFQLAIGDIELAIENGIPDHLQEKLLQRRLKCEKSLTTKANTAQRGTEFADICNEHLFTLSSPNERIQCAQSFVDISYDEKCGRKLVATKDIDAGTILCVEQPYVTVLDKELEWDLDHCHYCYRQILGGVPCSTCTFAIFCDKTCLSAAMSSFHQYDHLIFPYFHSHEVLHYSDLMSLRIVTRTGPRALYQKFLDSSCDDVLNGGREKEHKKMSGCNKHGIYESSYHQIYHLFARTITKDSTTHELNDFVSNILKAFVLSNLLTDLTPFFSDAEPRDEEVVAFQDFIAGRLFHQLENIKLNAVSFSELLKISARNSGAPNPNQRALSNKFAVGLFPTMSLANHSCSPNTIHIRNTRHCVSSLVSLLPLRAGDEITITYGPKFQVKPTLERQCELQRKFKFTCACTACRPDNNWTLQSVVTNVDEGLNLEAIRSRCLQCMSQSTNHDTQNVLKCTACLTTILKVTTQLDEYEDKLRALYTVIKGYEDRFVENIVGSTDIEGYWSSIEKLKPCLQFFGSYFKPTFNLTQVAQDLFKKVIVYYIMNAAQQSRSRRPSV